MPAWFSVTAYWDLRLPAIFDTLTSKWSYSQQLCGLGVGVGLLPSSCKATGFIGERKSEAKLGTSIILLSQFASRPGLTRRS
jgi:hypothetical protein